MTSPVKSCSLDPAPTFPAVGLLDLSAAFDCVYHSMLLERLRPAVGLTDSVLDWVRSFLMMMMMMMLSVLFGVPQGSVLGLLLYVLYTAELALVVDRHGLSLHQYAEDTHAGHRLVTLRLPSDVLLLSLIHI